MSAADASLDEKQKTWDALFSDCTLVDAKRTSRAERHAEQLTDPSLVYGEMSFAALGDALCGPDADTPPGGVFYDLGSGTGRAVVAAALLHGFERCVGFEVLRGLHEAAVRVRDRWDTDVRPYAVAERRAQRIEFERANFLDADWSDGTVVFANSTCYEDELMAQIAAQCARLRPGAVVLTQTKKFEHAPHLRLVRSRQHKMSWGFATTHVYVHVPLVAGKDQAAALE